MQIQSVGIEGTKQARKRDRNYYQHTTQCNAMHITFGVDLRAEEGCAQVVGWSSDPFQLNIFSEHFPLFFFCDTGRLQMLGQDILQALLSNAMGWMIRLVFFYFSSLIFMMIFIINEF